MFLVLKVIKTTIEFLKRYSNYVLLNIYNALLFLVKTLRTETFGRTQGYLAVPGCGLKCNVTQIDGMLKTVNMEDVNRRKNWMGSTEVITDYVLCDEGCNGKVLPQLTWEVKSKGSYISFFVKSSTAFGL